jgi:hypothetical protein
MESKIIKARTVVASLSWTPLTDLDPARRDTCFKLYG